MKKFILCLIALSLSGCWNYQELNHYAIVTAIAIDYADGEYQLSLLIANGQKINDTQAETGIVYGNGQSLDKAMTDIERVSPKSISMKHIQIVIISEDIARQDLSDIIAFLFDNTEQDFYFLVTKDGDALNILATASPLSEYSSQSIVENIKSSGYDMSASFQKFYKDYLNQDTEQIIQGIIRIKSSKIDSDEVSWPSEYIKLQYAGIIKNNRLIDWRD